MRVVLDRPAVPDGLQKLLERHRPVHEAGAGLGAGPAFDLACRLDLADGRVALQPVKVLQPDDVA